jgi:hypothetical protein
MKKKVSVSLTQNRQISVQAIFSPMFPKTTQEAHEKRLKTAARPSFSPRKRLTCCDHPNHSFPTIPCSSLDPDRDDPTAKTMDEEEELPSDKKKGKEDLQETLHPLEDALQPKVWCR